MIDDILWLACIVLSLSVLAACICRIGIVRHHPRNPLAWLVAYLLFAAFSFGVALDLITRAGTVWWYDIAGVAGLLLGMWITRDCWHCAAGPVRE
jgi:hypothetical protein